MHNYTDYEVYATYFDLDGSVQEEFVGTLELRTIHTSTDAPSELEIDGIVYKPQL